MAYRAARATTAKSEPVDMLALVQEMEEQVLIQARQPNIYAYKPHDKQKEFHSLQNK